MSFKSKLEYIIKQGDFTKLDKMHISKKIK